MDCSGVRARGPRKRQGRGGGRRGRAEGAHKRPERGLGEGVRKCPGEGPVSACGLGAAAVSTAVVGNDSTSFPLRRSGSGPVGRGGGADVARCRGKSRAAAGGNARRARVRKGPRAPGPQWSDRNGKGLSRSTGDGGLETPGRHRLVPRENRSAGSGGERGGGVSPAAGSRADGAAAGRRGLFSVRGPRSSARSTRRTTRRRSGVPAGPAPTGSGTAPANGGS